jgi:hypothetical protein
MGFAGLTRARARQAANVGTGNSLMVLDDLRQSSESSLKALSIILDAWDMGAEDGVAPEMMAYAALYTALTDLVALFGEEAVATLTGNLVRKVQKGDFTMPDKACH